MKHLIDDSEKDIYCGIEPFSNELPYVHENDYNVRGRKIYYISDLHVEFKATKGFGEFTFEKYIDHVISRMNGGEPFGDEPLFIVGDISCYLWQVDYFFKQLRMRREGRIVFVLGNHEIWAYDEKYNRELSFIIGEYRKICEKHDIILLHNELVFFYDARTGNGEILPYFKIITISANELLSISTKKLQQYSEQAKLIVFGGIGFSGECKYFDKKGRLYNAEAGLYRDIVPTLEVDIIESLKCEIAYKKVIESLGETQVIILTHCPFENWSNLEWNPNFIYVSGHTHRNYFEMTKERTIFADNQIGYSSDCFDLRYFYIDGTYDPFIDYEDGIHQITHEQYIDFNVGKNIKLKKQRNEKQIYMLKRAGFYMFVNYNAKNKLILMNGGAAKKLEHDIDYYYNNLEQYALQLKKIMDQYMSALYSVSYNVKRIGGSGEIHGCIVDIDYYNHIYINPMDGHVVPYHAIDMTEKYVYKNVESLIEDKCPRLLTDFKKWKDKESNSFMLDTVSFGLADGAVPVKDRDMYKASRIIRTIQYLLFQNIIRDWNDRILNSFEMQTGQVFEEIDKVQIDEQIFDLVK